MLPKSILLEETVHGCKQQVNLTSHEISVIIHKCENPVPRTRGLFSKLRQIILLRGYCLNSSSLQASAPDGFRPTIITKTKDRRVIVVPRPESRIMIFEEFLEEQYMDLEYCGYEKSMFFTNQRVNLTLIELRQKSIRPV